MSMSRQVTGAAGAGVEHSPVSDGLRWRSIGPFRGGRVVAVAGHPKDQNVFYFGACAGGVWKTTDRGTYWENVSDGYFTTAAVGAIAVSDSDPNVVYAGTGESCIRIDVSHGDGVYRSRDGGQTWRNMGLSDTRHIARIRVHPKDPDLVYVAALGHAFGPNAERGIFRSRDGGESWQRVLFVSERAGAADMSMDPHNPDVLYASIWQAHRSFWEIVSGGPDSGLYRSRDGGDTWDDLTARPGMPDGVKGRMGVAASPARAGRVWALIEAEEGGLFRSDDGGESWELMSDSRDLRARPFYYSHVFADPHDADTVWVLALFAWKSTDGGRTFNRVTTPHGDDHDLWIDPRDTKRMIEGNDGGACVSFDGGDTWSTIYNQPTGEFYRMDVDNRFPYRVYATQQDNSAVRVPSRSARGAIPWTDCQIVGSSESGHIAVKPDDADIVYSGAIGSSPGGGGTLLRYDDRTQQSRMVTVWPEFGGGWATADLRYRFPWTFPIAFSPHDPRTLYSAGNVLFRSVDEGTSWEPVSPDLTTNDKSKQQATGGPITKEGGAEVYCTIFAFAESPLEPGVLWAATDDGLVHVSKDAGLSWDDVTPEGLPKWTMICAVEPSRHDPSTAYIAGTRYKLDDNRPFLLKTTDRGRTWERITDGIPDDDFTRVIREDPEKRGVLYAGTETGVYVSTDDGGSWRSLRCNMPVVPVYDLAVKDGDLVAATHGRGFWILDDVTPLHHEPPTGAATLFAPKPTYRVLPQAGSTPSLVSGKNYMYQTLGAGITSLSATGADDSALKLLDAGENPPRGVIVVYRLAREPADEVALTFHDAQGREIKTFSNGDDDSLPARAGMNRFVWDMRYPEAGRLAEEDPGNRKAAPPPTGPIAVPGEYRVELRAGGDVLSQPFSILVDPRSEATQRDLEEQFGLLIDIRDKLSETREAIDRVRRVRRQLAEWSERAGNERTTNEAERISDRLSAVEEGLVSNVPESVQPGNYPARLNEKLAQLPAVVASADAAPTRQSREVFDSLSAQADAQIERLQEIVDGDVQQFVGLLVELDVPHVVT